MEAQKKPIISIVMPAYNTARYISNAIQSVLDQTFTNFELIVIDDCSTDETTSEVGHFLTDARVFLYRNEKNEGVSYSRNFGITKAKGTWIAFLDSDDMWACNKLQKQITFASENINADLIYTASRFIDENGKESKFILSAQPLVTFNDILKRNLISCSSVLVKKEIVEKIKMDGDSMHEDYACWLKILKEHQYAYGIDEPLLYYRISSNSKSSNRLYSARMLYNSYRYIGISGIRSTLYLFRYSLYSIKKRRKIKKSL